MFYLYQKKEREEVYLGEFVSLQGCDKAAEMKMNINHIKNGELKNTFYCKDETGVIVGAWVLEAKED